jgi:hypothetical protein
MSEEGTLSDAEVYTALLTVMRDAGLEWAVDEVEDAVRQGQLEVRDAPRATSPAAREFEVPEFARVRSLEAVRTPFSPRDQIRVAREAIERVVVEIAAMENEIRDQLGLPVFIVDENPDARPVEILRSEPIASDSLSHLQALLGRLEVPE